jgi:HSP20 family molecular chaperone IbpA
MSDPFSRPAPTPQHTETKVQAKRKSDPSKDTDAKGASELPKVKTTLFDSIASYIRGFVNDSSKRPPLVEENGGYSIAFPLPGYGMRDLSVEAAQNEITVDTAASTKKELAPVHLSYPLEQTVEPGSLKYSIKDGILTIRIKKHSAAKAH